MGTARSSGHASSDDGDADEDDDRGDEVEAARKDGADSPVDIRAAVKDSKREEPEKKEEDRDDEDEVEDEEKQEIDASHIEDMGCARRSYTIVRCWVSGREMKYQNLSPGVWFAVGVAAMMFLDVFADLIAFIFPNEWFALGVKVFILLVLIAYLLFLDEVANAFAGRDKIAKTRGCCSCCSRAAIIAKVWYKGHPINFQEIKPPTWFIASCASFIVVNIVVQLLNIVVSSPAVRIVIEASLDLVIVMSVLSIKNVARSLLGPSKLSALSAPPVPAHARRGHESKEEDRRESAVSVAVPSSPSAAAAAVDSVIIPVKQAKEGAPDRPARHPKRPKQNKAARKDRSKSDRHRTSGKGASAVEEPSRLEGIV